jgi:hypothetical protein
MGETQLGGPGSRRSTSVIVHCGEQVLKWGSYRRIDVILGELQKGLARLHRWLPLPHVGKADIERWKTICDESAALMDEIDVTLAFLRTFAVHKFSGLRDSHRPDLLTLLASSTHLDSTDPRDRILALVGLSDTPVYYGKEPGKALGIRIDYELSLAEVLEQASSIVGIASLYYTPREMGDLLPLPSWCPNWMTIEAKESLLCIMSPESRDRFFSTDRLGFQARPHGSIQTSSQVDCQG